MLQGAANLCLVLVPRHPERAGEVALILERSGLQFHRLSIAAAAGRVNSGEVLLADTIGEMMNLYSLSDIAFVGGSLVPTGGHNLLEPSSVAVPTLFGPNMTNFREIAALVLQYGAGIQVETPERLTDACRNLLASQPRCIRSRYRRH